MFKIYLKKLSKININFISTKKIGDKYLNVAIFGETIPKDLIEYKKSFFTKLLKNKKTLNNILKIIIKSKDLTKVQINILKNEIFFKKKQIDFLQKVYDIEANKLDNNYKINYNTINYDYYNKIFFGVDKSFLNKNIKLTKQKQYNLFISKEELIKLLNFSKKLQSKIKWEFGNYINLSHNNGLLKIPNKNKYHIKTIIILFFHELTHFFRYLNGLNNLKFDYVFFDSILFEEGIALYNEYKYGNKIIDYGKYISYYELCYNILLKEISLEDKKNQIYNVLKEKGFDKKKSLSYFYRFYRYSKIGGKNLFLKDLIYSIGYKKVKKIINNDKNNYKKIMSAKIGLSELNYNIIKQRNNFNDKLFFEKIVTEIKKLILKKGSKYL